MKTLIVPLLVILIGLSDAGAQDELREVREVHYQMGTLLDITIWHGNPKRATEILSRCVREVHRLNSILSNYDPQSSLSLLNARAGQGRVKVDKELFELLNEAIQFSGKTDGLFDVTVGPLMDLWRQAKEIGRLPTSSSLARTLNLVGYQKLKLYRTGEVELTVSGMSIDLGGIGKGYAVDRVTSIMKNAEVKSALINFGGSSIYALGSPPGQDSWTIGLKGVGGEPIGIIHLADRALSTSGSMGRYWSIGRRKYGHLINPKTGFPVSKPRVASVVASTATEAEALTKPIVLAAEKALSWTGRFPHAEALLISEGREPMFSKGFSEKHWQAVSLR